MKKAIQHHFEIEKKLLTREVRIKPITLFFIDNIDEYRNDDGGNVHCIIGKLSFNDEDLVTNLEHFLAVIVKAKPASSKGLYIRKCVVSATMSPGVQVAV